MDFSDKQPWDDIPTPKGELLTYVRKGVLWVDKAPHYIVELVKEPQSLYVMVYDVHPGTEKNPKKAANQVINKKDKYNSNTLLGRVANKLMPAKRIVKWKEKEPLFVAPVIPKFKATLTGKMEAGFFERTPDKVSVNAGKKEFQRGMNTGVFIGLSSVVWEDRITVPTSSVVKALRQYQDQESVFYDLESENPNSKDNPLSRVYEDNGKN